MRQLLVLIIFYYRQNKQKKFSLDFSRNYWNWLCYVHNWYAYNKTFFFWIQIYKQSSECKLYSKPTLEKYWETCILDDSKLEILNYYVYCDTYLFARWFYSLRGSIPQDQNQIIFCHFWWNQKLSQSKIKSIRKYNIKKKQLRKSEE